jgi:hypothetical protein
MVWACPLSLLEGVPLESQYPRGRIDPLLDREERSAGAPRKTPHWAGERQIMPQFREGACA